MPEAHTIHNFPHDSLDTLFSDGKVTIILPNAAMVTTPRRYVSLTADELRRMLNELEKAHADTRT